MPKPRNDFSGKERKAYIAYVLRIYPLGSEPYKYIFNARMRIYFFPLIATPLAWVWAKFFDRKLFLLAAALQIMVNRENADYWNAELAATNATIAEAEREIDSWRNSVILTPLDFLPELLAALAEWAERAEHCRDDANSCRSLLLTVTTEVNCVDGENFRVKAVAPNVTIAQLSLKSAKDAENTEQNHVNSVAPKRKVGCPIVTWTQPPPIVAFEFKVNLRKTPALI